MGKKFLDRYYELTDEQNQRLMEIIQEHTRLAAEATKLPFSNYGEEELKKIKARIEELIKERKELIGE